MINFYKDLIGNRKEEEDYITNNLLNYLYSTFSQDIPERNKDIFIERYVHKEPFKEIAIKYGLSVERTRSIVNNVLGKLRHPTRKEGILYGIEIYGIKEKQKNLQSEAEETYGKLIKDIRSLQEKIDRVNDLNLKIDIALKNGLLEFSTSYQSSIYNLRLSPRTQKCLEDAGLFHIQDLVRLRDRLLRVRRLGKKSLKEVLDKLAEYGYITEEEAHKVYDSSCKRME